MIWDFISWVILMVVGFLTAWLCGANWYERRKAMAVAFAIVSFIGLVRSIGSWILVAMIAAEMVEFFKPVTATARIVFIVVLLSVEFFTAWLGYRSARRLRFQGVSPTRLPRS